MEQEKSVSLPIQAFSYSSLLQLLRNPLIFKMKYVFNVYDDRMGVSGIIGGAFHEMLKTYHGGNENVPVPLDRVAARGLAIDVGLAYITNYNENYIDYGKTGSKEDILQGYTKAVNYYFAEEPEYHEILMCEEKISADMVTIDGDLLPLPGRGRPDLVVKNADGTIDIIDFKTKTAFTSFEEENYPYIIQAEFMFHLLKSKGVTANRMIFREIKRSENKDKTPQVRDWMTPFDHSPYHMIFYNLYRDAFKFISQPDQIFLPNLSDMFDGSQAGLIYAQGLISSDMSDVEVMHKVRDVAFTSKKFVGSRLDQDENKNLMPEEKIKLRLAEFGLPVEPVETETGPSVTRYRFKVSAGIRMSSILKHKADIARAIEAKGEIRILAPIPGTSLIGVEVENAVRGEVKRTKDLFPGTMKIALGTHVDGKVEAVDLREMPHLLIAGSTGSGKSVLLHNVIKSLSEQMSTEEMRLTLIDPKRVELVSFAKDPHVEGKIIYEYADAVRALMALTDDMEKRYKILEKAEKRNLEEFNASKRDKSKALPYRIVVIDEFADLMIRAKIEEGRAVGSYLRKSPAWLVREIVRRMEEREIEVTDNNHPRNFRTKNDLMEWLEEDDMRDSMNREDAKPELLIGRLAALGRAAGIHLIIATQSPRADVITGNIKANFSTRIALTVASPVDSEVILGVRGAEKLSGRGDMLFSFAGNRSLVRLQGFNN